MPEGEIPHLAIEDVDLSIQVLEVMRSLIMGNDQASDAAYRLVLTDLHQVTRNARGIHHDAEQ